jgi:hypothetical protein
MPDEHRVALPQMCRSTAHHQIYLPRSEGDAIMQDTMSENTSQQNHTPFKKSKLV